MTVMLQCICALVCVHCALGIRLRQKGKFADDTRATQNFAPYGGKIWSLSESESEAEFEKMKNVYGSWSCTGEEKEDFRVSSDEYLEANGHTWPKSFFATHVNTRKAHIFIDGPRGGLVNLPNSTVPFCDKGDIQSHFNSVIAAHPSFKKSQQLVQDASKRFPDKTQPVVFIDLEFLPGDGPAFNVLSNTLCSLKRQGLLGRTVAYSYLTNPEGLKRLKSIAPELTFITDSNITEMIPEMDLIRRLRWIPILHLLELGYQVLHIDADNKPIKDPFTFLSAAAKDVDVVLSREACMAFNTGTVFLRPTPKAIQLVRTMSGLRTPEITVPSPTGENEYETIKMATGDQGYWDCAVSHEVTNSDLKLYVIPNNLHIFHWTGVTNTVLNICKNDTQRTSDDLPIFIHTSAMNSMVTQKNLKTMKLWELDEKNDQCVDDYDPVAACNEHMSSRRIERIQAIKAKQR